MNIAFQSVQIYTQSKDKFFDESSTSLGENLLTPIIELKRRLESEGHVVHTLDMYNSIKDVDRILYYGLPLSILTADSVKDFLALVKRAVIKAEKHGFLEVVNNISSDKLILYIYEPPSVSKRDYKLRFHKYFGKIISWNKDLVEKYGYFQTYYPQPIPVHDYEKKYSKKKLCVMICSNKTSNHSFELYSERKKIIQWFEDNKEEFDLYGFGWENDNLKNYRGTTNHKLETLSNYKFSICYENICNIRGYITEKIFDCFFSGVVPIYWGASDIEEYIPKSCFIDKRDFSSFEEVFRFIKSMSENHYKKYIDNAKKYLHSESFKRNFSVESYVNQISKIILEE